MNVKIIFEDTKTAFALLDERSMWEFFLSTTFICIFAFLLYPLVREIFIIKSAAPIWFLGFAISGTAHLFGGCCSASFVRLHKVSLVEVLGSETLTHSGRWRVIKLGWGHERFNRDLREILPLKLRDNALVTSGHYWTSVGRKGMLVFFFLPVLILVGFMGVIKLLASSGL